MTVRNIISSRSASPLTSSQLVRCLPDLLSVVRSKSSLPPLVTASSEKTLPARFNMDLITRLQTQVEPAMFTPRAVYDGRKNMFTVKELPFGPTNSREVIRSLMQCHHFEVAHNHLQFDISLTDPRVEPGARGPKVYKVRLTKVAEINTEYVSRTIALSFRTNVPPQSPQSLRGWSTVSRQHSVNRDNREILSLFVLLFLA